MNFGEWKSPITLDVATSKRSEISNAILDSTSGKLFWICKKPTGQFVICTGVHEDQAVEWTPPEYNVMSRVHEYGGAPYFTHKDEVYFVNKVDQRIYKQGSPDAKPVAVTEDVGNGKLRYACGHFNTFLEMIIIVREDHRVEGSECINTIVAIDVKSGEQTVLCEGADFYKGVQTFEEKLIFISWDHPNMPWDTTKLNLGDLVRGSDGKVSVQNLKCLHTDASILQPMLLSKDVYFYLSDKHGFWNVWKAGADDKAWYESKMETGYPYGWIFGFPGYGLVDDGVVIGAKGYLLLVDIDNPQTVKKDIGSIIEKQGYKFITYANVLCHKNMVYTIGMDDPAHANTLIRVCLDTEEVYAYNTTAAPDHLKPYISSCEKVCFPTSTERISAYGYLYRAKNPDYEPDASSRPPLLVRIHGGPTGCTSQSLNMGTQYFTSRGFVVFNVDYRGSSSYGRSFRRALYGKWGVYDIEDAISAAQYLVDQDVVNKDQLTIDGGSAGGYTSMAMMVFKDYFHASLSYYGVSDLLQLAKFTHKFESRYLDQMIGKLPESEALYKARSPLYHAEQLSGAIGFFQGSEDCVCPPAQSKELYDAALKNKIPTFYVEYPGEAHGFKKQENLQRCLSNEMFFFSKIFGFKLADETKDPPPIENLPDSCA